MGKKVSKFGGMGDSVTWCIVRSTGDKVELKVVRDGQTLVFHPAPVRDETKAWQRKSLRQIKIAPAQSAIIAEVVPDSPAAVAGLKPGDEIIEVNGRKMHHFAAIGELVEANSEAVLNASVLRNGTNFTASLKPEKPISPPDEKPRVGVVWNASGKTELVHPGAIEQVVASVNAMAETFGALFARNTDIQAQHLGGAVKIMDVYARLFASENGWRLALWFSVLMNVNLAILNMLPIPVLDGGHIVLSILEAIRRRPISARILNGIQTCCAVALIGFMVYIAFYDVQELPWKRGDKEKTITLKFTPKTPAAHQ